MTILVTNDDGIHSPGLHALAVAMQALGEVWVVAPDRERNAVGHGLTLHKPLRIHQLEKRIFAINGTPSDCVNLGVKKLLRHPPALVVAGINKGVNLGDDVTYSGTVSAALEGTILGIPSLAVSQEGGATFRFLVGAAYALRLARLVLREGLPEETLLNINVPDRPLGAIAGVRFTCLSRRRFDNPIIEKVDPRGKPYYWIAGTRMSWNRREGSDHQAIERGMVSVTPLHLDLTHYGLLEQLHKWEPTLRAGKRGDVPRLIRATPPGRRRSRSKRPVKPKRRT
ncbi:MAG: 5'/3'-nucleotidase SurE [Nitrospirales bacterium]